MGHHVCGFLGAEAFCTGTIGALMGKQNTFGHTLETSTEPDFAFGPPGKSWCDLVKPPLSPVEVLVFGAFVWGIKL